MTVFLRLHAMLTNEDKKTSFMKYESSFNPETVVATQKISQVFAEDCIEFGVQYSLWVALG